MNSAKPTPPKGGQRAARRRLTYPQYAAEKQISVDTVRRKVARGELEVERVSPKCIRILEPAAD